jgi:phage terminase large subunit
MKMNTDAKKKRKVKLNVSTEIFNKVYIPYLQDDNSTQIFYGGSSSGKSVFLAQRTVLDVMKGGRNYLVIRNVAKTIRGSVYNEIIKAISSMGLNSFFTVLKSEFTITCFNGYQILFCGLDDPEKIKSITPAKGVITDIWIEEATEAEYNAYKQLTKRLRGRSKVSKRLIMSFNPILQDHWIYNEFFLNVWDDSKRKYKDDKLSILKTTYKDNKFLTEQDIRALEDETDKYFYEVYTLGNWGVLGAVIFKNWRVEDLSWLRDIADNYRNGLDFGFAEDPSALPHTHYDRKKKTIYVLDELYMTELTNDVLATEVKKIIGNQLVVCDSAEPKSIKELRQYGINAIGAKKGKDSVNHGIQWLQQQTIVVDVKCQNMKNELMKYKWKEDRNGNVLPVPVDKDNHLIDALRYAYEDEFFEKRPVLRKPSGW